MPKLKIIRDPRMTKKFNSYSPVIKKKLTHLRKLIIDTAEELDSITEIEETLKWGEPSYLTKKGSTIRMDWKEKTPDQYQIYFKCTSKLVPTFREVFRDSLNYENNRAIIIGMKEKVPEKKIKKCIAAALQYHLVKEKPHLGIK